MRGGEGDEGDEDTDGSTEICVQRRGHIGGLSLLYQPVPDRHIRGRHGFHGQHRGYRSTTVWKSGRRSIWPSYTYSLCVFRVSKTGALVATSASIKGKIIADDVILKSISVKANDAEKYFRGATRDLAIDGVTHHFVHGIYTGTSSTGSPNAPFEID